MAQTSVISTIPRLAHFRELLAAGLNGFPNSAAEVLSAAEHIFRLVAECFVASTGRISSPPCGAASPNRDRHAHSTFSEKRRPAS